MKMMLKLTVLVAILLFLAGAALADWCVCYQVNAITLPGGSSCPFSTPNLKICFDYGGNSGLLYNESSSIDLTLFFDAFSQQALGTNPLLGCVSYMKFHGDHQSVFHSIWASTDGSGCRCEVRGHQIDMENCNYPPPPSP